MRGYIQSGEKTVKLNLRTCKQPSMSDHRGRTWDHGWLIIDGIRTEAWLDTTWGEYIYFVYKEKWYKVKMFSETPWDKETSYDIDPFATTLEEIKLKDNE